ncbi:Primosomal protein DnaI [Eubacteriaceae bacterium CHKCI004]|nr:Primosomal protein DnaI [Eubacteriaceae bacterium CHKCI004]
MRNQKTVTASSSGDACAICHGTGWKLYEKKVEGYDAPLEYAAPCPRCHKIIAANDESGIPSGYRDMDLYRFDFEAYQKDLSKVKKIVWSFFEDYKKWESVGKGIYFWSDTPGSGKTFLACCVAQSIRIKYGCRVRFITVPDYLSMVGDSYKRQMGERDESKIYRECELLIFDDVGVQKSGDWQQSEIFRLIDTRMKNGLVTIFTSNFPTEKLKVENRIINRIQRVSIEIQLPEESIRQKKAVEERDKFLSEILA